MCHSGAWTFLLFGNKLNDAILLLALENLVIGLAEISVLLKTAGERLHAAVREGKVVLDGGRGVLPWPCDFISSLLQGD